MENTSGNRFSVDDLIIYPMRGIGKIEGLENRLDKTYFRVRLKEADSEVLVPRENAEHIGLRHLATEEETENAMRLLSERREEENLDWKSRLQKNESLLREGTLSSLATVLSSLYKRSKVRELPTLEKKLYDNALKMFIDESSSVYGISDEEMRKKVFASLES